MHEILTVGQRFSQPVPGTVIAVLGRAGVVTGYEVRLDGSRPEDGETWLVPVEAIVADATRGREAANGRETRQ